MLTYCLRKTVSVHETDDRIVLWLSHPLKTISLHPFWIRLFQRFSRHEPVAFETIQSISKIENPDELEFFLDDLVRKGFLHREGVSPISDFPDVSIIIPVRNRPDDIASCLQSLQELNYPGDKVEIIVVDDASTDHTPDMASRFGVRLIPLKQHKQAAYCRNLAARHSRGDLLAFIDSDCRCDPEWLRELVPAFKDRTVAAVGGVVESYFNQNGLDRYEQKKSSLSVSSRFKRSTENDPFFYLPACNLIVRRAIFLQENGFREELFVGEDVDLCWRLREHDCQFEYRSQGRVFHKHRNRLTAFCRRRFEYGTSEPLLNRLHPRKMKQLYCPPPALLFWVGVLLSFFLNYLPLLFVSGAAILADGVYKWIQLRKKGLTVNSAILLLSVLRSKVAFMYLICSFVSRYYLFSSLVIVPFAPKAAAAITLLHLVAAGVEYVTIRPQLNPVQFLFYFTLEQLSYQFGVWWGCFKYRCFRPVNPIIVSKISD